MKNSNSTALTIVNNEDRIRQLTYYQRGSPVGGRTETITPKIIRLLPGANDGIDPNEWAKVEKTKDVEDLLDVGTLAVHTNFDPNKLSKKDFESAVKKAASITTIKAWLGKVQDNDRRKLLRKKIDECTRKAS